MQLNQGQIQSVLEGKPLWFILLLAAGYLVYLLLPKFVDKSRLEKKVEDLKKIIETQNEKIKLQDAKIAELNAQLTLTLRQHDTIIGAYKALRHRDKSLPDLKDLKELNE